MKPENVRLLKVAQNMAFVFVIALFIISTSELGLNQKASGGYSGLMAVSSLFGIISGVLKSEIGMPINRFTVKEAIALVLLLAGILAFVLARSFNIILF